VRGLRPLREMVTEFLHRSHGLERARRQVLVGPGSKELIFLTQLAYAGELLVPSPSWVSYAPQARIIGRRSRRTGRRRVPAPILSADARGHRPHRGLGRELAAPPAPG